MTVKYSTLKALESKLFKQGDSIPAFVKNINIDAKQYPDLVLESGLTIPTPTEAIDKTRAVAKELIDIADGDNLEKFSKYQDIIGNILKFVRNYDVLYVQTTNSKYRHKARNQELIKQFVDDAHDLDKQINEVIPELLHPISKITSVMKLDNTLEAANKYEKLMNKTLCKVYSEGLDEIFRMIAIGENMQMR